MHTTISACILSYNRPKFLCEAVESVLRQTVRPTEIIIFDNGSDPQVLEQVRPHLSKAVRWVGADANHGPIWNFRRAVQASSSEFLFILHDDDRLCPNFIEQQLAYLVSHPEVGAVTCNGHLISTQGERLGKILRSDFVNSDEVEHYSNAAHVAMRYACDSCLPFSPMFYRADFVRGVQLREEFGKVVDAVFFCDLADAGPIAYQAAPLYECRIHPNQDSSHFPPQELAQLSDFLESRTGDAKDVARLRELLVLQHTSRQLRNILRAIYPLNIQRLGVAIAQVWSPRFSIAASLSVCWRALTKRSTRWFERMYASLLQHLGRMPIAALQLKRALIKLHFFSSEQLGVNPLRTLASIRGSFSYLRDLRKFRRDYKGELRFSPCLGDRYQEGGSTKSEYFWQDLLVARKVFEGRPVRHVDIGSRIDGFVAHVASFREIEVFDIRVITATIPGVIFRQADMMSANLVLEQEQDNEAYCDSLSCLHAIEHFGLGRYGDTLDAQGYRRGIENIGKLLKPNGRLYLSTPIGRERVEFNANWVFHPQTILQVATDTGMRLDELIVLDEHGVQQTFSPPSAENIRILAEEHYRLGIFCFTKLADK